ncbi:MAG: MBL fold metallo-hydrolase [Actinobacteria bacterium]|nr:MAG: MBL fold metallo-hydrolase [Actinomycetota bacterium]
MREPDRRLDAKGVACHVLIDGWRTVSPRFVFHGYDDDVQGESVRPYLDTEGKLPGRVAAMLIESADGLVLVDAGNGRFAPELDVGHVHEELASLGIPPWDIRCVIITHGHADHVGGLVGPRDEPAFPDARHVIHRIEAEFWSSAEAQALPNAAGLPARTALMALLDAELLDTVEGDAPVATGIDAIEAPGHTPGHLAVIVNDAVLWAGDTFVSQLNIPHPEWVSLSDMDGRTNEATRRRLLERAAAADLLLAAAHMSISGTVARTGDGYELRPSERS